MADFIDSIIKILPIGTFFSGVAIERYKRKEIILEKEISIQRIGTTVVNHPFYGNIQIVYNELPADNLYQATVELQNMSKTGLSDFEIIISVPAGFVILQDSMTLYQGDISLDVGWSDIYRDFFNNVIAVMNDEIKPATHDRDIDHIRSHRKYSVKVLNKGRQIFANLLITGPSNLESVLVGVYEENVEVIERVDRALYKKKYDILVNLFSTILFLSSGIPIALYSTSVKIAVVLMAGSLYVSYYSIVAIYYILSFLKDYFKK